MSDRFEWDDEKNRGISRSTVWTSQMRRRCFGAGFCVVPIYAKTMARDVGSASERFKGERRS